MDASSFQRYLTLTRRHPLDVFISAYCGHVDYANAAYAAWKFEKEIDEMTQRYLEREFERMGEEACTT